MKWQGLNELREKYLSFFESKNHTRLPSFSLIPQGDKSLLLINSGMAPPVRSASGHQILNGLDRLPVTARILKCWATSLSATTSKSRQSNGHGNSSPKNWKCQSISCMFPSLKTMMKHMTSGQSTSVSNHLT